MWNAGEGLGVLNERQGGRTGSEGGVADSEERRYIEERERFWRRRRNPCKAQHDAGEPDYVRWDARQQEKASSLAVRARER